MNAPARLTLLQDDTPRFLIDVLPLLDEADRIEFRRIGDEFEFGMNATIEGVARALRQWTKKRPITDHARHSRRLWAIRLLEEMYLA